MLTKLMKNKLFSKMLKLNQLRLKYKICAQFCVNMLVNVIHNRNSLIFFDILITFLIEASSCK